jgi:hypothetical protein
MLVNLDHLTLIGTGSEWFWSMLQFVVVAITLYAIYRQVRLQAGAAAIQQLDTVLKDWTSEAFSRKSVSVMVAIRDGLPPDQIPYGAASSIGDFWEGIAYLVRSGHIDRRLLHEALGGTVQWWWAVLEPWTRHVRVATEQAQALEDFEWLAALMAEMDGKTGASTTYDDGFIARTIDKRIENDEDRIRFAEAMRGVVAQPPSARPTAKPRTRRRAKPGPPS